MRTFACILCLIGMMLPLAGIGTHTLGAMAPGDQAASTAPGNEATSRRVEIPNEKLHLFTDRNLYAVGEEILFRVYNGSEPGMKQAGWSRVLYLELMDDAGRSLARGKYLFGRNGSSGSLNIPVTVQTGNYFIRAYTKWMRNFPASEYARSRITIINPASNILQGQAGEADLQGGSLPQPVLLVSPEDSVYETRSAVRVRISIPDQPEFRSDGYCVSVVRKGLVRAGGVGGQNPASSLNPEQVSYLPETEGLTVSGQVLKNNGDEPAVQVPVHFSLFGMQTDYAGFSTEKNGKFYIPLPEVYGLQNLFVATDPRGNGNAKILIDNDYSTEHSGFTAGLFNLSQEEKILAREVVFAAQLTKAYAGGVSADTADVPEKYVAPFYGSPAIRIIIDDYVPLPTLEEFIVELIREINIRKRGGKVSLGMTGIHSDLSVYPPLVLYDMVPVFDLEGFLKLSYENIERIEVVNATYRRGDLTFGGILSVFSRERDLSGMKLTAGSYFYDFEGYRDPAPIEFPDYFSGGGDPHIPDFRNTLYWDPRVDLNPGESASFEFYTSDQPGEYSIHLWGISPTGTLLRGTGSLRVK